MQNPRNFIEGCGSATTAVEDRTQGISMTAAQVLIKIAATINAQTVLILLNSLEVVRLYGAGPGHRLARLT